MPQKKKDLQDEAQTGGPAEITGDKIKINTSIFNHKQ